MLDSKILRILCLAICLNFTTFLFANSNELQLEYLAVNGNHADSLIVPRGQIFTRLEDPTLSFKGDFSKAYWIKPKLENPKLLQKGHLLVINPTTIYRTQMFIPELNGDIPIASFGRFDVNTHSEYSHHSMIFTLPDDYQAGQDIYFYLQARSNTKLSIQNWQAEDYHVIDRAYNSLNIFIFSCLFTITLINLIFYYLVMRDKTHLKYIIYLCSFLFFLFVVSRKIYTFSFTKLIPIEYNLILFAYTLVCLCMAFFIQDFLDLKRKAFNLYRLINATAIVVVCFFLTSIFVHPVPYIIFNIVNCMALVFMALVLFYAVNFWRKGDIQAKYFVYAFLPLFIAVTLRLLVVLSVIPHNIFSTTSFELAIVLQAIILTLAIANKMLNFQIERDEVSYVLQFNKDISQFLTQVSDQIRVEPTSKHDTYIVKIFFNKLAKLVNFHSGAIVYSSENNFVALASHHSYQNDYDNYIKLKSSSLAKLSKRSSPTQLYPDEFTLFENGKSVLLLPVSMRKTEWSAMLLCIDDDLHLNDLQKDTLQRYATELVRTLVTSEKLKSIAHKAETDDLTQLNNRGTILKILSNEIEHAEQKTDPLSIAFIDIDHFKQINDTYGHHTGDTCLTILSSHLKQNLPQATKSGRMGGDEFLIVFSEHNAQQAKTALETMATELKAFLNEAQKAAFTLSIGIAEYHSNMQDVNTFLEQVDKKLYKAKINGRNQISL